MRVDGQRTKRIENLERNIDFASKTIKTDQFKSFHQQYLHGMSMDVDTTPCCERVVYHLPIIFSMTIMLKLGACDFIKIPWSAST